MARASRNVWSQRVRRWKESGLPASEFAKKVGLNENTLRYWATQLRKEAPPGVPQESGSRKTAGSSMAFVEVGGFGAAESAFEIAFASGLVEAPVTSRVWPVSGREAGFHVLVDQSLVQPSRLPPIR